MSGDGPGSRHRWIAATLGACWFLIISLDALEMGKGFRSASQAASPLSAAASSAWTPPADPEAKLHGGLPTQVKGMTAPDRILVVVGAARRLDLSAYGSAVAGRPARSWPWFP